MKIKYVIRILSLQKEFLVSAIVNKIFMIKWNGVYCEKAMRKMVRLYQQNAYN